MPEDLVLVVGAGASLAEALGHRPRQTREHPPLDTNFFSRVARFRESDLSRRVAAQARQLGEPALEAERSVSLEAHLGRLYFNVHHNPRATSVSSYFDVIELYRHELVTTTNWMIGRRGSMYRLLQQEVARGARISIVTFNHDLLLENALEMLARPRTNIPWSLNTAYGFHDEMELMSGAEENFDFGAGPSSIPLFKLHGSINWVVRTRSYYPPAEFLSRDYAVRLIVDKRLNPEREQEEVDSGRGRSSWYLFPLIVPPVYEKHGLIRQHLQEAWDNAESALLAADRVVFWGYSFPAADVHARYFFQGLAENNAALRSPTMINPDPQAAAQLWSVLRPRRVDHYREITDYLG